MSQLIYDLIGVRGRTMKVYCDRAEISASDGTVTVFFFDCIGVQFKKAGTQAGFIQLETTSGKLNSAFHFDDVTLSNKIMIEVAAYISQQIGYIKAAQVAAAVVASSSKELQQLMAEGELAVVDEPIERKFDLASSDRIKAEKGKDFIASFVGFSKEQLLQRKEELLDKLEVTDKRGEMEDIRSRIAVVNNLIAQAVHLERGEISQAEFDAAKEKILSQF